MAQPERTSGEANTGIVVDIEEYGMGEVFPCAN